VGNQKLNLVIIVPEFVEKLALFGFVFFVHKMAKSHLFPCYQRAYVKLPIFKLALFFQILYAIRFTGYANPPLVDWL